MSPEKSIKSDYKIEHLGNSSIIIPKDNLPELTMLIKSQIETDTFLESWQAIDKTCRHFIGTLPSGQEIFVKRKRDGKDPEFKILTREFSIQDKLQEIVKLPKFQQVVTSQGFSSIAVNSPLLGVIDRLIGKFVFSHYHPGTILSDYSNDFKPMIESMTDIFYKNSINPIDFNPRNIIMTPDNRLIIIDTELFHQIKLR